MYKEKVKTELRINSPSVPIKFSQTTIIRLLHFLFRISLLQPGSVLIHRCKTKALWRLYILSRENLPRRIDDGQLCFCWETSLVLSRPGWAGGGFGQYWWYCTAGEGVEEGAVSWRKKINLTSSRSHCRAKLQSNLWKQIRPFFPHQLQLPKSMGKSQVTFAGKGNLKKKDLKAKS